MAARKTGTKLPRHFWFYVAMGLGAVSGGVSAFLAPQLAILIAVNVFFAAYVATTWLQVPRLDAAFLKRHAEVEDAPAPLILLVTVMAVAVSVASLFVALAGGIADAPAIVLGIASVVLGWLAIHTMWAMHYAFEYYAAPEASPGRGPKGAIVGGLGFPGADEPDAIAFLYFAYVIGMTAQTSDTEITSNGMRRIVTVHGVFSFFFNTVIVASAVNIVLSLGS
ncbi:MAG: DUF1345 domain-containing protein [Devosia sp.]